MKTTKFKTITLENDQKTEEAAKSKAKEQLARGSTASTLSHKTPYQRMMVEIDKILDARNQMVVYEQRDNQMVNVTPKLLDVPPEKEQMLEFVKRDTVTPFEFSDMMSFKSFTSTIIRQKASKAMGLQLSLDDVIEGIGQDRIMLDASVGDSTDSWQKTKLDCFDSLHASTKWSKPFIRITLRKTELLLLYEHRSVTALKTTEEGKSVQADNRAYEYLTLGKGKIRRRSESETQTYQILCKSRGANTEERKTCDTSCFVSNYESFDILKKLEDSCSGDEPKKLDFSQSKTPAQQLAVIDTLPSFHWAGVVIKRLLAGNTYEEGQRRFRNMSKISRTVRKVNFKYAIKTLFTIYPAREDGERKAVADMSICCTNSDILAVAYGIYSYQAAKLPTCGQVCIWSIKNPRDPERFYDYSVPVVAVEFSPYMPSLLAVGLFDGSVEVRDVAYFNKPAVAVSKRTAHLDANPILSLKWIKESTSNKELDPFLALSQDGSVTQHRVIRSPFLASFEIMSLKRLEGLPEGLPVIMPTKETTIHANRCPQGLSLIKHPTQLENYHILTDEGCLYKCSTNYQNHYVEALRTHEGAVNHMDFSPWSPILFLTCGNDWCIRVWISGIFQPLLTLKNVCQPYNWAAWSRTNSTILIAINRVQCEIWDLGRNILKPASVTEFNTSYNTLGIFSLDGSCLLIGKERGQVLVNALDELPFPPHYQYDCLEKAIYKAISNYPDLLLELKNIGYFGYPNKGCIK